MSLWHDEWVDEDLHIFCGWNMGTDEIRIMNETQGIYINADQAKVLVDRLNWAIRRATDPNG